MIPMRLRLENFMSYAELDLDLSGMHLAVLTGPNGAGKSTLLDAITFALWEKARASAEQLIRLGAREMWVELEFELDGRLYRVSRRRTRKAGVGSQLEFHMREGAGWVPLTGETTKETQARIVGVVRLDYETFIHSAYLRQGRADSFTTKTPQERKAVLAEMLGLGAYDELAQRARGRWKAAQARADQLETEQEALRADIEGRAGLEAGLLGVRQALFELGERLEGAERAEALLRDQEAETHRHEAARHQVELALQTLEAERAAIEREAEAHMALLSDRERIERARAALAAARDAEAAHLERARASHALWQQERAWEARHQGARLEAEAARRALEADLERSRAAVALAVGCREAIAACEARVRAIAVRRVELERAKEKGLRYRAQTAQLLEAIDRAKGAGAEAARRLTDFAASAPEPHCPLCETGLDAGGTARVATRLQAGADGFEAEAGRLEHALIEAEASLADARRRYAELSVDADDQEAELLRLGEWRCRLATLEAASSNLPQLEALLAAWEPPKEPAELAGARSELAAIGYDPAELAVLQARIQEHRFAEARSAQLAQAQAAWPGLEARLALNASRRAATEGAWHDEQAEHEAISARLAEESARLGSPEVDVAELRRSERALLAEAGRLEADRARLAELALRLEARAGAWLEAVADAQAYKELTTAFGRNGIPAFVIENAIPEIEQDANRLLARMTDNRLHVRLATQREKKTGGLAETLEISISDEVGCRPYELYSGGEAFRVNFALRLALSRLLARRSGARLQTLIIDEGFGTQDERGRERLVEAINAVSDEYARILVITHIRELKDAFNTHIEVVKRGGVSHVRAIA